MKSKLAKRFLSRPWLFAYSLTVMTVVVTVVAPLLSGCGRQTALKVRLSDLQSVYPGSATAAPRTDLPPVLRVAIASVISPKESLNYYGPLLDYLSDKTGWEVILVQRETYAEINALLKSGDVDLAFVCTYAYIQGQQEFGLELLVAPVIDGRAEYRSYLIVPGDSKAKRFEDLKGQTFAFTDPMSTSGRLVPLYWLNQMGYTPRSFFSNYVFTYSHDNSIRAVADNLVDGAAVDSLVFESMVAADPELSKQVKIVARSQAFGAPPVVVRPGLDSRSKGLLKEVFLGLSEEPQGREILKGLRIDGFVPIDDSAYDGVREMAHEVGPQ